MYLYNTVVCRRSEMIHDSELSELNLKATTIIVSQAISKPDASQTHSLFFVHFTSLHSRGYFLFKTRRYRAKVNIKLIFWQDAIELKTTDNSLS